MLLAIETLSMYAKMKFNEFCVKEDGDVNVVSIVVLIGIALILAIMFRGQIEKILGELFKTISSNADKAIK